MGGVIGPLKDLFFNFEKLIFSVMLEDGKKEEHNTRQFPKT